MIHVAVLLKPYIHLIESGKKTVECRLTRQARAPYEAVSSGDRIYFKESSGPYRFTAIARKVYFENNLSPSRIRTIRKDYNHHICGNSQFWTTKKYSNYLTLVWLKEINQITTGPALKPLQGQAWWTLSDKNKQALRGKKKASPALSFSISITPGNIRNSSLYATSAMNYFPSWCIGGDSRSQAARPLTLILRDGPLVETDLVGSRKLFRTRCWGEWFKQAEAKPGDRVVFSPISESDYFVGIARS